MKPFTLIFTFLVVVIFTGCSDTSNVSPSSMQPAFQAVNDNQATILQKGKNKTSCSVCGMYLPKYYKTNHASKLKGGEVKQYCSLHCLIHDNEVNKNDLYHVMVVDVKSLKFISAQNAYYVVGSDRPGTMSHISKYAFAKRKDADSFAKKYGGSVMNFYDAYTVAYKDFLR